MIATAQPARCTTCEHTTGGLERTRFFVRQLIGPADLTQDQDYFRDRLRRHNRMLHGWGIVCGATVRIALRQRCTVIIEPGYIIGPWGDEIVIEDTIRVDLCKADADGNAVSPCGSPPDPWCADVHVRQTDQTLYLAIRYAECHTRPVPVYPAGCGCDEAACEYSRSRDSYAIRVLRQLPSVPDDTDERGCPPCPPDPWVILGAFTVDGNGRVTTPAGDRSRSVWRPARGAALLALPSMSGRAANMLRDLAALEAEAQTAPVITVRRADGTWAGLPVHFSAREDETYASFLSREGEREFVDPSNGASVTLQELYEAAGVRPDAVIADPDDALIMLEGITLPAARSEIVQERLESLVKSEGLRQLERDYAGSPGEAYLLPATALRGVDSQSWLADYLAGQSVQDVAAISREDFIEDALAHAPQPQPDDAWREPSAVWTQAVQLGRISDTWRQDERSARRDSYFEQ